MAKFHGAIGFATKSQTSPGVWENTIVPRNYYGDTIRDTFRLQNSGQANDDVNIANRFSIMADSFANANIYNMRYVVWNGAKWKIENVEVQRPRLILSIGGLYNE